MTPAAPLRRYVSRADGLLYLALLLLALAGAALFGRAVGFDLLRPDAPFWQAPPNDLAGMLTGVEAVLGEPWRFPPTVTDRIVAPREVSIVYTDSLPWLTLALKATGLGGHVNALALALLINYLLQPIAFALLLRALGVRHPAMLIAGGLVALAVPAWILRHGHVALTAHWILLSALALAVGSIRLGLTWRYSLGFAGLAALATGIHAYHLPPLALCWVAALISEVTQRRTDWPRRTIVAVATWLSALVGAAVALGYGYGLGELHGGAALGYYSMNLVGPVLPQGSNLFGQDLSGGWFEQRFDPNGGQWFEGYSYLGAGAILLVALAAAVSLRRSELPRPMATWLGRWGPLTVALICLYLAAVGPKPYLGGRLLFQLPVPDLPALGVFRAHGRFFWLPTYALLAGAILILARHFRPATAVGLIAAAFAIQYLDTRNMRAEVRTSRASPPQLFYPDVFWRAPQLSRRDWIFVPSFSCVDDVNDRIALQQLSLLAIRRGGSTNSTSTARPMAESCELPAALSMDATPKDPTLVIALRGADGSNPAFRKIATVRRDCRAFQAGVICGHGVEAIRGLRPVRMEPIAGSGLVSLHRFDQGRASPLLAGGWASPDPAGNWSDGVVSELSVPLNGVDRTRPVVLILTALGFAEPPQSAQTVFATVGGRELATWEVQMANWKPYLVEVSPRDLPASGPLRLILRAPGARRPTPEDPRRLAIGLKSLEVTQTPAVQPEGGRTTAGR